MVDHQQELNQYYNKLSDSIQKEDDRAVLKISDQILNLIKNQKQDDDIRLCKIISAIRLNQFDQALTLINTTNLQEIDQAYAYAYILYKQNKYNDCLAHISKIQQFASNKQVHPGFLLLKGQILYRQQNFDSAVKIYDEILQKFKSNDQFADILVNYLSSSLMGDQNDQIKAVKNAGDFISKNKLVIREILYNLSLLNHVLSQKQEAKDNLKRFQIYIQEELGDQLQNYDNFSFSDYVMGTVQKHFYDQIYDNSNLSQEQYDELVSQYQEYLNDERISKEDNLKLVLQNNLLSLKANRGGDVQYGDSLKKIDELIKNQSMKQTKQQIQQLKLNKILISLHKNKMIEANKYIFELESQTKNKNDLLADKTYILAKIYYLFKQKNEAQLQQYLSELNLNEPYLKLVQLELLRSSQDNETLVKHLIQLQKNNDGLFKQEAFCSFVFTVISKLSEQQFNSQDIQELIISIIKSTNNIIILQFAADAFIKKQNLHEAVDILERLYKQQPQNQKVLINLISCYQQLDQNKLQNLIQQLPQPTLISDVLQLNNLQNDLTFAKQMKQQQQENNKMQIEDKSKSIAKKKKKKKIRYPKNFDPQNPGNMPDPERWLPKYERKQFKKLYKKKNVIGGRNQGSANVDVKETIGTFKNNQPSTANIEISKAVNKSKKKKK